MPQLSSLAHQCQEAAPVHDLRVTFRRCGPEGLVASFKGPDGREGPGVSTVEASMSTSSVSIEMDWSPEIEAWRLYRIFLRFIFLHQKESRNEYFKEMRKQECAGSHYNQKHSKDRNRFLLANCVLMWRRRDKNTFFRLLVGFQSGTKGGVGAKGISHLSSLKRENTQVIFTCILLATASAGKSKGRVKQQEKRSFSIFWQVCDAK